jgi:hypothetical protein
LEISFKTVGIVQDGRDEPLIGTHGRKMRKEGRKEGRKNH